MAATAVGNKRESAVLEDRESQVNKRQKNTSQEIIEKVGTLYGSNGSLVLANRVAILPKEELYRHMVSILVKNLREEVREVQDEMDRNISQRLCNLEHDGGYSLRALENWAEDEALIKLFPYFNRTRVDERTADYYDRVSHRYKASILRKFLKKNSEALKEVKSLNLPSMGLKRIPKEISYLVNLEELVVNDNDLTFLPEELGGLKHLKKLEVSNNKLRALPLSFCELTNLELLDVSRNNIIVLPSDIGNLSRLQYLYANNNWLILFPVFIREIKSLTILNLSDNRLESAQAVVGCTNLEEIDLSNNNIKTALVGLKGLVKLERLLMQNNKIPYTTKDIEDLKELSEGDYMEITTSVRKIVAGFEVPKIHKLKIAHAEGIKRKFYARGLMCAFRKRNLIIQI